MVEDVVCRVAVVNVAVEVANAEVAAHEAAGAQGGAKQWWRGGVVDEDGDALRTKRGGRRQTAKAEASTEFA